MIKKTMGVALATVLMAGAAQAGTVTLINNATTGLYNNGIGNLLNGTSAAFPTNTDPVQTFATAPSLAAAAAQLGDWLTSPAAPGGTWSATAQAIPGTWAVNTEDAIIYAFDAGDGLTSFSASFGIDNGIFVWLDGVFLGGAMAPGGAPAGEYTFTAASVSAGTHYLQILREDHGGATGYSINVTANTVPEPGSLALAGLALLAASRLRRRA